MKSLNGIMPPIPTPFEGDEICAERLDVNFKIWNSSGLRGVVVMGSNGESVFLTRNEKLKLVAEVKRRMPKEMTLIAGTGSDSIKETVALTNEAASNGADYALVLTPSFYKSEMKPAAYIRYYSEVADRSSIPVLIYNVPKFTGVDIEADTVAKLALHGNIAGIKNSSENIRQTIEIIDSVPEDFAVIVGTASVLYSGISAGACGGILALANIAPAECEAIRSLTLQGKHQEALLIQKRLLPVNKAVTARFGVAGLKAAMDLLGMYGGAPRLPLAPLDGTAKEEVKRILEEAGLLH